MRPTERSQGNEPCLGASTGPVVRSTGSNGRVRLNGSNRWNPCADVAELVDALVSGSAASLIL